ncbi:hypothetical protein ACQ4PT_022854 [Festuca glaucescens]
MAEDGTAAAVNVSGTATGSNSVSRNSVVAEASRGKRIEGHATPEADPSDGVAAMMGRLKLTSREAKTLVMDDEDDAKGCPEWAIVGKVMAPNPLHIETIKAVLRPAWGNPKGMIVRPMGSNLFLAELESKADRDRIMKGGPWMMGKNAILLKEFDPRIKSADVVFDSLLVWARIHNLAYNLMNTERGTPLAGMIGRVEFLDVDENGRAWGEYLRARVQVDVAEPLMRCVAVGSSRLRTTVYYEVKYEKLPMYCFSCGLIGHSSLVCPTPASRDEDGKLPWDSDRVCIPDQKKKEQRSSSHGLKSGQGSSTQPAVGETRNLEASSPVKPRKQRAWKTSTAHKETGAKGDTGRTARTKRKQKVYVPKVPMNMAIENGPVSSAMVPIQEGLDTGFEETQ